MAALARNQRNEVSTDPELRGAPTYEGRGQSGLSGQPPFELREGVFRFCQIVRDITSPPSQIPSPRPSGSPVLPKSLMHFPPII
ncbi:hypothetical protein LINGRAHAP2_LOCUS31207 [Linum grandiflorum]